MLIKRRNFLKSTGLVSASLMLPGFLKAYQQQAPAAGKRVLVVIQLSGGNDALNTIIPYRSDTYYRERPVLAIPKEKALALTEDAGINPALPFFKGLYDSGELAIINNVGYPNPDRSHFRSMDIWQTASESNEYLQHGWIGRYLDAKCAGCDKPTQALEFDDVLSMALKGKTHKGLALKNPRKLYNISRDERLIATLANNKGNPNDNISSYLYKTLSETLSSAAYIYRQSLIHPPSNSYPDTEIGNSLKQIASLIQSEIDTSVYYLSLGSFDTHIAQDGQQKRLFHQLNESVEAFVKELKHANRFKDVMLMTFSEFGRRVKQNASGGTDHGAAGNMFFISGGLKEKGLINELPDLNNLENGDLKHSVDFRSIYATLMKRWLDSDDIQILGRKFAHLSFV